MVFGRKANKRNKRALTLISVIVAVLFVFLCTIPAMPIADAISPENYVEQVSNVNLDWYMDEDFLDLARLKSIVKSWFINPKFDFENLSPIVVAVLDTGVNCNHETFLGKYDANGSPTYCEIGEYDVLYRNENGEIIGKNTATDGQSYFDDAPDKHGSHVAGIVAAFIHELNLEEYIKIMPVKCSYIKGKDSSFTLSAIENGVEFAIDNGADVINMSFTATSSAFSRIATSAQAGKAVFVAAAGNGRTDSSIKPYYPGANENVIGVMNYSGRNLLGKIELSSTSNFGGKYDICAPGSKIMAANGDTDADYKSLSGTSMASPVVAFAAALATLKYRALGAVDGNVLGAKDISKIVKNSWSEKAVRSGVRYNVLDICKLAQGDETVFAKLSVLQGDTSQTLGNTHDVVLKLDVYPSLYADKGEVSWYIDDIFVGTGPSLTVSPKDSEGSTRIEGVWVYSNDGDEIERSATCTIIVQKNRLDENTIKQLAPSVFYGDETEVEVPKVGSTINFAFDELSTDYLIESIIWYVNGEESGQGLEFDFFPQRKGRYTVQAKVNGVYAKSVEIDVVGDEDEQLDELNIAVIVLSGALVCSAISIVSLIVIKCRRIRNK